MTDKMPTPVISKNGAGHRMGRKKKDQPTKPLRTYVSTADTVVEFASLLGVDVADLIDAPLNAFLDTIRPAALKKLEEKRKLYSKGKLPKPPGDSP